MFGDQIISVIMVAILFINKFLTFLWRFISMCASKTQSPKLNVSSGRPSKSKSVFWPAEKKKFQKVAFQISAKSTSTKQAKLKTVNIRQ